MSMPKEAQTPSDERPRRLSVSEGGRDELNLAEFPITVLTDKIPKGLKTLTFSDHVKDSASGEMVTRTVTISGSDVYGLPGPLDMDVLLCLIQITKLTNNFTDSEVKFSRGELLRMLRLPDSGKHYRRIDESLRRWLGVTLYHDSAWWDKHSREWSTNEGWHILEHIVIVDRGVTKKRRAKGQLDLFLSSFTWNKIFFRSCQAENIKRLDLDVYFSLERAISKRMFRFLDKRFYHRDDWTFDLKEFAFEHIGISRNYDVGEIKSKLRPSIEELEAIGFLEPMAREERYVKLARGEWTIKLVRARERALTSVEAPTVVPELIPPADELERALTERGITPAVAAELVGSHPAESIRDRLEMFDWLSAKKDKRVSKNPGGFLAESIRKSYVAPKGFESKAEQERKRKAEIDRRRQADEAKRKAEADERAREEAERTRITSYLGKLTLAEREALQAEALEAANPFFMSRYRDPKAEPESKARYLKLIVETHVSGILESQGDGAR